LRRRTNRPDVIIPTIVDKPTKEKKSSISKLIKLDIKSKIMLQFCINYINKRTRIGLGGALNYVFNREQLEAIEDVLDRDLLELGVHSVFLIDMAGNIVANRETGEDQHDIYSLAALAAGNFGAVSTMAKLIGEEEFSLLFHRGQKESIHFSKVGNDFLLITIFGKEISLGFLRLKVAEVTDKIVAILGS
jgi:predicted regulator of Ras-like GTPase activity (Roadblock/LC7/MglB family)